MATSTLPATAADLEQLVAFMRQQLEGIGAAADTLTHFAAYAAQRTECDSAAYDFHAIQAMAERIGAIAEIQSRKETVAHLMGTDAADQLDALEATHG
jgi:hypothetical protein